MKAAIRAAYLNALHFFLGFLSTYKYIFFRNSNLWKKWTVTPPPNNWWKLIFGMLKGKSRSLDPRVGNIVEISFERKCSLQVYIVKIYEDCSSVVLNGEEFWPIRSEISKVLAPLIGSLYRKEDIETFFGILCCI